MVYFQLIQIRVEFVLPNPLQAYFKPLVFRKRMYFLWFKIIFFLVDCAHFVDIFMIRCLIFLVEKNQKLILVEVHRNFY